MPVRGRGRCGRRRGDDDPKRCTCDKRDGVQRTRIADVFGRPPTEISGVRRREALAEYIDNAPRPPLGPAEAGHYVRRCAKSG